MLRCQQTTSNSPRVVRIWQALRLCLHCQAVVVVLAIIIAVKLCNWAVAQETASLRSAASTQPQLYDALDAHPPRWSLDTFDCDARVLEHKHLADGGVDGRACETITFAATHGTTAVFAYPIEPVMALNELNAVVSVMSARPGARIGFRVRYPYARDSETRRPVSAIVYGTQYTEPGEFHRIGVGAIQKQLRLRTVAVRQELGVAADLADPYIDAIVINAFCGAGSTTLRIDELHVNGMVPVGQFGHVPRSREEAEYAKEKSNRVPLDGSAPKSRLIAFPPDKVTRVLQHNGEPLHWVRSLGFDAVLLSDSPDAAILREAIQSQMKVYAPPPTAPDPKLQTLLDPIAAWYVGSGLSLDRRRVEQTRITSSRIRNFPARWQRPIVAAPTESSSQYVPLVDALIDDLPDPIRGVTAREEVAEMVAGRAPLGAKTQAALGIASMPPERAMQQSEAIANSIGAPPSGHFRWHSMWIQAMRGLESSPTAIIYRSSRSLASGSEMDSQRAMALSYVNRMIAMIEPWISGSRTVTPFVIEGTPYHCTRLNVGETDFVIATSTVMRGAEVLAGDGASMDLLLPPEDAVKNVWRLTHFSAERISPENTETGPRVQIVSPDAVEIIVLSGDPTLGAKLVTSAQRFAQQASMDRWQLTQDLVSKTRQYWNTAIATGATRQRPPEQLLGVASRTLTEAEPLFRAGDVSTSLRMARRADAWALRSHWQLAEALMPDWPMPTSCPPILCGNVDAQIAWHPLMQDEGWGANRLTTGSLDRADVFAENRWTFGKRAESNATSNVGFVRRGTHSGPGALRATVTSMSEDQMPGGYEGTALQIASPSIRVPAGKAYRIDAMVRTLGFGGPHQGVLVYDTTGGQEMGVLIRGQATWTPVRLYRQAIGDQEVKVMFELIGAGEATIDEVKLKVWEPKPRPFIPLRPIAELPQESPTRR